MTIKTELKVQLLAGNTVVAESPDTALWQRILAEITAGPGAGQERDGVPPENPMNRQQAKSTAKNSGDDSSMLDSESGRFAKELEMSHVDLLGAANPTLEEPHIHLDHPYWEAFKRNTPKRGDGAIPPITLAATALALWSKHAKSIVVNVAAAQKVLKTIGIEDHNPNRGLKNCSWLQYRDTRITINPAEYSKALAVFRAYCRKTPVSFGKDE